MTLRRDPDDLFRAVRHEAIRQLLRWQQIEEQRIAGQWKFCPHREERSWRRTIQLVRIDFGRWLIAQPEYDFAATMAVRAVSGDDTAMVLRPVRGGWGLRPVGERRQMEGYGALPHLVVSMPRDGKLGAARYKLTTYAAEVLAVDMAAAPAVVDYGAIREELAAGRSAAAVAYVLAYVSDEARREAMLAYCRRAVVNDRMRRYARR